MAQGFDLRHLSRYAQAAVVSCSACAPFFPLLFSCCRLLLFLCCCPLLLPLLLLSPLLLPLPPVAYLLCPSAAPAPPPRCVLLLLPLFLLLLVLGLEVGQEGWIWGQKNALAAPRGQTGGIRRMIVSALFIYQCYHQVFSVLLG